MTSTRFCLLSLLIIFAWCYTPVEAAATLYPSWVSGDHVTRSINSLAIVNGVPTGTAISWCLETGTSTNCQLGNVCSNVTHVALNGYATCQFNWLAASVGSTARLHAIVNATTHLYSGPVVAVTNNNQCGVTLTTNYTSGIYSQSLNVGLTSSAIITLDAWRIAATTWNLVTGTSSTTLTTLSSVLGPVGTVGPISGPNTLTVFSVHRRPLLIIGPWIHCQDVLAYYAFLNATRPTCSTGTSPTLSCVDTNLHVGATASCSLAGAASPSSWSVVTSTDNTVCSQTNTGVSCNWVPTATLVTSLRGYVTVNNCTTSNSIPFVVVACPASLILTCPTGPITLGTTISCGISNGIPNAVATLVNTVTNATLASSTLDSTGSGSVSFFVSTMPLIVGASNFAFECPVSGNTTLNVVPATMSCSTTMTYTPLTVQPGVPVSMTFSGLQDYNFARQATIQVNGTTVCTNTIAAHETSTVCNYTWPATVDSLGNSTVTLFMNDSFCVEAQFVVPVVEELCVSTVDFNPTPIILDSVTNVQVTFTPPASTYERTYGLTYDMVTILCTLPLPANQLTSSCTWTPSAATVPVGEYNLSIVRL